VLEPSDKKRRIKKQHLLEIAGLVGDAFAVSRLTKTDVDNCFPSFSPDGRYITFTSYRDENGEIYLMTADGAEPKRLTTQPQKNDYGANFSADGKKILFASSDDRLSQANVTLQADGSGARSELFHLIDTSGNQMITLMNNPSPIGNPVFSPDSRQIAFEANTGGNIDIYLMDTDGKNRRRITTNNADDGQPVFSPDGKSIVFVSRRDDNYELYMMDVDGSNQRRLTYTPWEEYEPVFSPDGKKLAYVSAKDYDLELMLLDLKTQESLQLTKTPGANINPAFSPDGKLAFASDRTDYLEIYLMDLRRPVSQTNLITTIKRMIYRNE
jgi:Tol biopolymer transport system component